MFQTIPDAIVRRMNWLEALDSKDRTDGTEKLQRLRQIPADTGKFLALLAANSPVEGELIEIGTSAGYSTLWLSLACQATNRYITTYEILPEKVRLALETFESANVVDKVKLVEGDARDYIKAHKAISFCFLDAEKDVYGDCYELVVPRLVKGGWLVADNAINHREVLKPMIERSLSDKRVDALVVPIGKGELVCRKL